MTSWGPSFDKICHLYASDNDPSSSNSSCNNKKILIIDQSSAKMNTLKLNRMAIKDNTSGNNNDIICTKHYKAATIDDVETKINDMIKGTSVS